MKHLSSIVCLAAAAVLAAGCSSIKVTDRDEYAGGPLPRPGRILVYSFAATPADLPSWTDEATAYSNATANPSAEELAAGRKLGTDLAKELVKKIDKMGMTGVLAEGQPGPQRNDIAITGYFTSIDKGSAVERVVIGFGKGSSDVKVHASGYRMTDGGMERLGGGAVEDGGKGKSPGLVVPTIVTIATANPIGLVVGGAVKAEGEISGRTTDVGGAERIADEIAKILKQKFQQQGWIDS